MTILDYLVPANGLLALITAVLLAVRVWELHKIGRWWVALVPKVMMVGALLYIALAHLFAVVQGPATGIPFVNKNEAYLFRVPLFLLLFLLSNNELTEWSIVKNVRSKLTNPNNRRRIRSPRQPGHVGPDDQEESC